MSSTDDLLREVRAKTDDDLGGESQADGQARDGADERSPQATRSGFRARLPSPPRLFSPKGFLVALALTVGGFLLGGMVPFVGGLAGLVGVFLAGFLLGALGRRRYLELALAGAATAGVAFVLDRLVLSVVAGFALPLTLLGATAGLVAAVLGHYFGRDLNDGLTRSL